MIAAPLRMRSRSDGSVLAVNDGGSFFLASPGEAERIARGEAAPHERDFLDSRGHLVDSADGLGFDSHAFAVAERLTLAGPLDYLILVPTLRCNLSCNYCQVSRASERARGFDWDEERLAAVCALLDSLPTDHVKIEFQGGEPTLRPDLLKAVIERCERFAFKQFVICTNLQSVGAETLEIFDRTDVYVSTSLDGDRATHERNRTAGQGSAFFANLEMLIGRYGPGKVSALPTIDPQAPPEIGALIDAFRSFGLTSIFLRPINFHGFARKRHRASKEHGGRWRDYYERFLRTLIDRNWTDRSVVLEETYFSICLRRVFQPGRDRHVDLRNPNPVGIDYLVIDHDGTIYPTDEARMLSRSKVIDLALGRVGEDWKGEAWRILNAHSTSQFDPDCARCAYQPYCGRDLVDDLARYGRIDLERTSTDFCRKHLWLFDLVFDLIYDPAPDVQYSLRKWLGLEVEAPLGERLE